MATKDRAEASGLLAAKNQATAQPILNVAMARTFLSAKSPELMTRTWGRLMELMAKGYTGATAKRWKRFQVSAPMRLLADFPLYQTEATHFLEVLNHERAGVSTNVWLRILHNCALDLGWLLAPVMPKRTWPKVRYGSAGRLSPAPSSNGRSQNRHREKRAFVKMELNLGNEAISTMAARLGLFPHYSNVPHGLRVSIEHALKKELIRVVVCTSTLVQGVNPSD